VVAIPSSMPLGSFRHGALAELSVEDLDRIVELDETLFVEHKNDTGKGFLGHIYQRVTALRPSSIVGGARLDKILMRSS
jgi:hypothetical protein